MMWGESSALAAAGPQAARLAHLFWVFFAICALVYLTVITLLIVAMRRRDEASSEPPAAHERGRLRAVALGGIMTTVVLVTLLIVTVMTGHGLNPLRGGTRDATVVRVIARQWWWEFRYPGASPDAEVTTANELHIPVGRPVLLELASRDVIHSFWVPALYGKRDLIPGHDSTAYIQADRPGLFRGQCAEFCGAQHANMGFVVVAEPSDQFETWLSKQRQPASTAVAAAEAARGRDLFLAGTCPMCHTIAGTVAHASMGPDLTHLATRLTLGAGSLANARDHLAAWISDAQAIKPGNRMPPIPLPTRQLADLVSYLETLR
jgi:cytochrome c oxidase subunit II